MRPASNRAHTLAATLLTAALAVSFTARAQQAARAPTAAQPNSAQVQPMIVPGKSPDLMMFYTGDVIGYLIPCG